MIFKNKSLKNIAIPILICLLFFILYTTLSIVRHNHFQSYGYDLGINDQVVWEYSKLNPPITTIGPVPGALKLASHIEATFFIISPFYWIWSSPITLLILQSLFFCFSGLAIYLLAKKRKINYLLSIAILTTYLAFYGVQNAIWFDAHSIVFGAGFLAWFLYFLQEKKIKLSILFFLLTIGAKENFAFITFFVSLVYFISRRKKISLFLMLLSLLYLFFIFFIFFPHILNVTYQYSNKGGLFSNLDLTSFFDTKEKINVIFYTLANFGFIPLLNPLILLPLLGDLGTYFVIGSDLTASHGLYMQYRVTLSPLMAWAFIMSVNKYKKLNTKWLGVYLIICAMLVQYSLHLPLSYLSKQWFWNESKSVKTINIVISNYLPKNASAVAQNNIIPHVSERKFIYELYPVQKTFKTKSFCGNLNCDWFRWAGSPDFLLVDISPDWDERHFLINREQYIKGLNNLEKAGVIKVYKKIDTTVLYKVTENPQNVK